MERRFGDKRRAKTYTGKHCRFCGSPNWNATHKCPSKEANCRNCEKRGHFANTIEEQSDTEQKLEDTDETIYHIEQINQIKEKNHSYTANVIIKGKEKKHS